MIVSFMGCGNSNKKSNKTMRVGVVTYTADDPFINAMVDHKYECDSIGEKR